MLFKLLKFIFYTFVSLIVLASLYIGYLYIQNPTVVSRIASMMMGEATGELEIVKANEAFPLNTGSPTNITEDSLQAAIKFSKEMGSHALLIYQGDAIILEKYFYMLYIHLSLLVRCRLGLLAFFINSPYKTLPLRKSGL